MVPGNRFGQVYVKYVVKSEDDGERERLVFWEKNTVFLNKETDVDNLREDEFFELFPGVQSIAFEYLKVGSDEGTSQWQETWDQSIDKGLPRAIRVVIMEDIEKAPICVIAPIGPDVD